MTTYLALAVTDTDPAPILLDGSSGITGTWADGGPAILRSGTDGTGTLELFLRFAGSNPRGVWNTLAEKLYTGAVEGTGAGAPARSNLVLIQQLYGELGQSYIDVLGVSSADRQTFRTGFDDWDIKLLTRAYARGNPTLFRDLVVPAGGGGVWVGTIPGVFPALARVMARDNSTGGKRVVSMLLGQHAGAQLGASDQAAIIAATAQAPGASVDNPAAYGGKEAQVVAGASAAAIARFAGPATGRDNRRARIYARVKSQAVVVGPVPDFAATVLPGQGLLGTGEIVLYVEPRRNGQAGPASALRTVSISNIVQSGVGAAGGLMTTKFLENFEGQNWSQFEGLPVLLIPGAGSASVVIDGVAPVSGSYSAHYKAVGDTVVGSTTRGIQTLTLPQLPDSKVLSLRMARVPLSWSAPVVLAAPGSATTPSGTGAGGLLPVGTYTIAYAWTMPSGETTLSPTATATITAAQQIQFAVPATPTGASGFTYYVSDGPGSTNLLRGGIGGASPSPTTVNVAAIPTGPSPQTSNRANTDTTPRLRFGSKVRIYPTGIQNEFAAFYGTGGLGATGVNTGTPLGDPFLLTPASTTLTGAHSFPTGTVTAVSTTNFPASGFINVAGQQIRYTSKDATHFFGCSGGTGAAVGGAAVRALYIFEFSYDAAGDQEQTRLYLNGNIIGGSVQALPNPLVSPPDFQWTVLAFGQAGAQTEEFYDDDLWAVDGFTGAGLTQIAGGSAVRADWDATPNADEYWVRFFIAGIWYRVAAGSALTYLLDSQFPAGVTIEEPPTALASQVQTQLLALTGAVGSNQLVPATGSALLRGESRYEWRDAGVGSLPPVPVRQGLSSPPWFVELRAVNAGGGDVVAVDSIAYVDERKSKAEIEQLDLAAPAGIWDFNTDPDGTPSCELRSESIVLIDPFDADVTGWTADGATFDLSTAQHQAGAGSGRLHAATGPARLFWNGFFYWTRGTEIYGSFWIKGPVGQVGRILFADGGWPGGTAGLYGAGLYGAGFYGSGPDPLTVQRFVLTGDWQEIVVDWVAPADVIRGAFGLDTNGATLDLGDGWYIDTLKLSSRALIGEATPSAPLYLGPGPTELVVLPSVADGAGGAVADALNAQITLDLEVTPRFPVTAG